MTDRLKGSVSVGRTVRVKEFESFRVDATAEFYIEYPILGPDDYETRMLKFQKAFDELKAEVEEMVKRA